VTQKDKLKLCLDIPMADKSKDALLGLLLDRAASYVLSYCRLTLMPETLLDVAVSMAAEDFGRMGSEGVSFRTASGATESYRGEYSPQIMSRLRAHRRLGGPDA